MTRLITESFSLTPEERNSALWKKLELHIQERMDMFRKQNDMTMPEVETAKLRGKIAFAKELIALSDEEFLVRNN